jgi:hypothetical protein
MCELPGVREKKRASAASTRNPRHQPDRSESSPAPALLRASKQAGERHKSAGEQVNHKRPITEADEDSTIYGRPLKEARYPCLNPDAVGRYRSGPEVIDGTRLMAG